MIISNEPEVCRVKGLFNRMKGNVWWGSGGERGREGGKGGREERGKMQFVLTQDRDYDNVKKLYMQLAFLPSVTSLSVDAWRREKERDELLHKQTDRNVMRQPHGRKRLVRCMGAEFIQL